MAAWAGDENTGFSHLPRGRKKPGIARGTIRVAWNGLTAVIQTALFFILGFLSAVFLALLVAPAIWRRAVLLTRRRVEAALPLTMNEIQADKDRLRAEHAVAARQLEMTIKSQRDKISAFMLEEGRHREEFVRLSADVVQKDETVVAADTRMQELRAQLDSSVARENDLAAELAALQDKIGSQAGHIERLGRMYDEASFSASSRQIEMVAQETKLEKLADDLAALRAEVKTAQLRTREAEVEAKAMDAALKDEHKKLVGLENKLAQMTSGLADAEDRAERRENELSRLREQMKGKAVSSVSSADLDRLEVRANALMDENKKLRAALEAVSPDGGGRDTAMLREQIGALAAEVVNLTASLEGPESPIYRAIDAENPGIANKVAQRSLADRIRALRAAETARRD